MLETSRENWLRWTILGALGASLGAACGGTATSAGDGDGDSVGDGDDGGDGDFVGDGDSVGDGDGDVVIGDGDGDGSFPACTNPRRLSGGFVHCDEGYTHRTAVDVCESEVPREEAIGDPETCLNENCCVYDADCTGPNQFCQLETFEGVSSFCATGCLQDSDCTSGMICECGSPMGRCVTAECQADDDCAGDARCADWAVDDGCGAWTRYSCQTRDDECASDFDCLEGEECDGSTGVRLCQPQMFSCAVGRPFLVNDEVRTAGLCERDDWLSEVSAERTALSEDERAALAASWEEAARLEHASVAAFARFSLQLLSLGAPADLIERTNQALIDETKHARLCFGLATRYRGRPVGPGKLDMHGVLAEQSLAQVVELAIIEGCVGETVAALEAAEAAAQCTDAEVRVVLEQIVVDESSHAELAWRFVDWALTQHPELLEPVRRVFSAQLRAIDRQSRATGVGPLAAHGVLGHGARRAVRQRALASVVAPCAERLLCRTPQRARSPRMSSTMA